MLNQCDQCAFFVYDEDYEEYVCDIDMDEDEYSILMSNENVSCPFFRDGDDYKIVRHQM